MADDAKKIELTEEELEAKIAEAKAEGVNEGEKQAKKAAGKKVSPKRKVTVPGIEDGPIHLNDRVEVQLKEDYYGKKKGQWMKTHRLNVDYLKKADIIETKIKEVKVVDRRKNIEKVGG